MLRCNALPFARWLAANGSGSPRLALHSQLRCGRHGSGTAPRHGNCLFIRRSLVVGSKAPLATPYELSPDGNTAVRTTRPPAHPPASPPATPLPAILPLISSNRSCAGFPPRCLADMRLRGFPWLPLLSLHLLLLCSHPPDAEAKAVRIAAAPLSLLPPFAATAAAAAAALCCCCPLLLPFAAALCCPLLLLLPFAAALCGSRASDPVTDHLWCRPRSLMTVRRVSVRQVRTSFLLKGVDSTLPVVVVLWTSHLNYGKLAAGPKAKDPDCTHAPQVTTAAAAAAGLSRPPSARSCSARQEALLTV